MHACTEMEIGGLASLSCEVVVESVTQMLESGENYEFLEGRKRRLIGGSISLGCSMIYSGAHDYSALWLSHKYPHLKIAV